MPTNSICALALPVLLMVGCGDGGTSSPPATASTAQNAAADNSAMQETPSAESRPTTSSGGKPGSGKSADDFEFAPLTLNSLPVAKNDGAAAAAGAVLDPEQMIRLVMERLHPLQILLGQWRGTTRREYEGFKAVDSHEWIWDLQTDPRQPALVLKSDKSPYLRTARLTWDNTAQQFALTATDSGNLTRNFLGQFTEPVHEVVGSDDKLHRVFRLEFTEVASAAGSTTPAEGSASNESWRIAFAQQENNRYLLEVDQRRASADFRRFDTVSTQREGTSFALSDSDYAEKTCVISQGLGTIELTYKGRSYWVCCTGCKAAFEEDPETWIARDAKRTMTK